MTCCPNCGTNIPLNSPTGQCPKCLVQIALNGGAVSELNETLCCSPNTHFRVFSVEELASGFPQLEILELLGAGGMGAVYKARHRGLDRMVALKILPPEIGNNHLFEERFTREARALAKLSHTNIVTVFDFGQTVSTPNSANSNQEPEPVFYIMMEFVDGVNLRQLILSKKLTPADALAIVPQICEALQFAHDEGIVHRDIKPENILIDKKGKVKIADFGLAKLLGTAPGDQILTGSDQVMGTLRYMAPEQMAGSPSLDHRADIYSLGVVFYELLTGDLPMGHFVPPSEKIRIDVRLDEVVLRSLANEPERRYQQARQLKTDVDRITSSPDPLVAKTSVTKPSTAVVRFKARSCTYYSILSVAGLLLSWFFVPGFFLMLVAATAILLVIYLALSLVCLRSVTLNDRGITLHRILGADNTLAWKEVIRATPVSRLRLLRDIVLGYDRSVVGPVTELPVRHYFRIEGKDDAWFFCPNNTFAFITALRSHDCLVDAPNHELAQHSRNTKWLFWTALAFVLAVFVSTVLVVLYLKNFV